MRHHLHPALRILLVSLACLRSSERAVNLSVFCARVCANDELSWGPALNDGTSQLLRSLASLIYMQLLVTQLTLKITDLQVTYMARHSRLKWIEFCSSTSHLACQSLTDHMSSSSSLDSSGSSSKAEQFFHDATLCLAICKEGASGYITIYVWTYFTRSRACWVTSRSSACCGLLCIPSSRMIRPWPEFV